MDLSKAFQEHQEYLANYAKKYLKNKEDSEDAVQDTFVKASESMDTFNNNSSVRTWLTTICRNVCLDKLKEGKRQKEVLIQGIGVEADGSSKDELDLASPEQILIAMESGKEMLSLFEKLPERIKTALNYKYAEGLSYKEISVKMGVPVNTVRTWLRRGRTHISHTISPQ